MELSIYYPIVTYMGKSGGVECLSVPKTITTLLNREDGKILIECLEENNKKRPCVQIEILIEKIRKITTAYDKVNKRIEVDRIIHI